MVGTVLGFGRLLKGLFEIVVMRTMDIITLPRLAAGHCIVAILGPGLMNAMLAVSIVVLLTMSASHALRWISEASRDYVTAARMVWGPHPPHVQRCLAQLQRPH